MHFLGLNLPPLTLILLLVFLWLILLVLLVWSWLRPSRPLEPLPQEREPDRARDRRERDAPVQLPRPTMVREVRPEPRGAKPDDDRPQDNPFVSLGRNSRRDDFDF